MFIIFTYTHTYDYIRLFSYTFHAPIFDLTHGSFTKGLVGIMPADDEDHHHWFNIIPHHPLRILLRLI